MAVVSMSYLLEAGVHFGHQTKRWNPKMKEYIFTTRDDIYIIDLQKTLKMVEEAYDSMKEIAEKGGDVLFVGTRKQSQQAIKEEAERVEMPYVTERWLGGTLTNFKTIRNRVKRMEQIERMENDGTFDILPKKEVVGLRKEHAKLEKLLSGIRNMKKLPNALFVVDPTKEAIAINEARIKGIPVFGIVDTNCDPDMVDYIIPANDDAIRAVKLLVGVMANAVAEANGKEMLDFITESDKRNLEPKEIRAKREERKPEARKEQPKQEERKVEVKTEQPKQEEKKVEEKKAEVKEEFTIDLDSLKVADLRDLAKMKEIKGYSTMKKAELIDALK